MQIYRLYLSNMQKIGTKYARNMLEYAKTYTKHMQI